jgi:hypothetical protein
MDAKEAEDMWTSIKNLTLAVNKINNNFVLLCEELSRSGVIDVDFRDEQDTSEIDELEDKLNAAEPDEYEKGGYFNGGNNSIT